MDKINLAIVRQQFAQCVFTHKVLEKATDRIGGVHNKIKWTNVSVLGSVVIILILQTKLSQYDFLDDIAIAITVFEILFVYIQKEFSFEKKEKEYKQFALKYLELRDKYKNFIVDIMNNSNSLEIEKRRDLLQEQYQIISSLSPQTTYTDYKEAQSTLLVTHPCNEEFTWSDAEIDRFLPQELRLCSE